VAGTPPHAVATRTASPRTTRDGIAAHGSKERRV
jgi:hypothetical protein